MEKLKFKGTQGPWRIKKIFDEDYVPPTFYEIRGANDKDSDFPRASLWGETETEEADARLIAAAPELLYALHDMIKVWEELSVTMPILLKEPLYNNAKWAIKKALEE